MPAPRQRFAALDTSFLTRLAAGEENCETVVDWLRPINIYPVVTGTVVQELQDIEDNDPKPEQREKAKIAKSNLPIWGFVSIPSDDLSTAIAKRITQKLFEKQALPDECYNDALVIAEAAYNGCQILITERSTLLDSVNIDAVRLVLIESDVSDLVTISADFIVRYIEGRIISASASET